MPAHTNGTRRMTVTSSKGAHDAYAPVVHNRAISRDRACWCVVDSVIGPGTHLAEAHWHLNPLWDAERIGGGTVRIEHEDGTIVWLITPGHDCEVVHGSEREDLGWCAPIYGSILPTSTIRIARRRHHAVHHRHRHCRVRVRRPFIRPHTDRDVPEGAIAFSIESEIGGAATDPATPRAPRNGQRRTPPLASVCVRAAYAARPLRHLRRAVDCTVEEGVL